VLFRSFCRETDDIADEIADPVESLALLAEWGKEIHALYHGTPSHPVSLALVEPIQRFGLKEKYFLEILEGFEMDGGGAMLRPSLEQLERYCYCVACCVGLLSVEIFGYRAPVIPEFALHLGHAFQLTNILRDVAEDAERGRIYLPGELLAREGLADIAPDEIVKNPATVKVCAELGEMARARFQKASDALPSNERRHMRPALLMRGVYENYLREIERQHFRVDGPPIKFSKGRKIRLVLTALAKTI